MSYDPYIERLLGQFQDGIDLVGDEVTDVVQTLLDRIEELEGETGR